MGTYSYFVREGNVGVRDREFYEYLKTIASPDSPARAIIEWYDTLGKPVTFPTASRCRKWRRVVNGDQLRFSFACFNGWRLMGYDYPEFRRAMRAMEYFLDRPNGAKTGVAHFLMEGNPNFEFRIDYRRGTISYNCDHKNMRPWAKEKLRAPSRVSTTGIRVPPPRRFVERPSLDVLMGLKKRPKRPPRLWRVSMAETTVLEEFGYQGRLVARRRTFSRPQAARQHFYRTIQSKSRTFAEESSSQGHKHTHR